MKRWQAVVRAGWLVVVAAVIGASATPTAAAAPVEIYRYPPGHASAVQLAGHGFGHGIGMSQWGANGAATRGLTWRQIVGFYYPGTSPSSWSGAALKIRLDQLGTASTYLKPSPGLQIQIGRPAVRTTLLPVTAPTGKAATAYRILPTGVTLRVQVSDGTVWSDWDVTQNGSVPSTPFVVSRPDGGPITSLAVRDTANRAKTPTLRAYRGVLVSYPGSAASSVSTVNEVAMDLYLRGVVPAEVPASWPAQALAAQSVAARTYAAHEAAANPSTTYDLCDTTRCQVYLGMSDDGVTNEHDRTTSAIAATAGVVLTYQGAPAFTQFSASNGGYSVAGNRPYLVAKTDPYDGVVASSAHAWTVSIPISTIKAAYPSIGTLAAIRVLSRDGRGEWGGRVLTMAVDGTSGSVQVTGASFAVTFGLRHQWFKPTNAAVPSAPAWPRDVNGDRRGDLLTHYRNASSDVLWLHRGNGSGGIMPGRLNVGEAWGPGTRLLTAGPWDLGESADLMAIRSDGSLWMYPGRGDGTFGTPVLLGFGWAGYVSLFGAGDVDGDSRNDLIGRDSSGRLFVIPGDAAGGFLPRRLVGPGWTGFTALFSPADFTGDGKVDLMTRDNRGILYLYPGRGDGTFSPRSSLGVGWAGYTALLSPGDFTGDGRGDVIARGPDSALYVWAGAGNGRFVGRTSLGAGWASYLMVP